MSVRRGWRLWLVLLLVAAGIAVPGTFDGPPPAHAQATTLLTNMDVDAEGDYFVGAFTMNAAGVRFQTGDNAPGYSITSVSVDVHSVTGTPTPTLRIFSSEGAGTTAAPTARPDTALFTLDSPSSFGAGLQTFTAPASGVTLEANTYYWLVFSVASVASGQYYQLKANANAAAHAGTGSETGWSFHGYRALTGASWSAITVSPTNQFAHARVSILGEQKADTTAPTLKSASVNEAGTEISLTFSENLAARIRDTPDQTGNRISNIENALTITVNGRVREFTGPTISPNSAVMRISVTGARRILSGQDVVVAYSDPTAMDDELVLEDLAGNDAASFTTGSGSVPEVVNGSTYVDNAAPTFSGAAVRLSGDSLGITFTDILAVPDDEMMLATFYETLAGSFAITANGAPVSFTIDPASKAHDGGLSFDLARLIGMGHKVTLEYTKPDLADPDPVFLDDESGNRLESFSADTTANADIFFNDSEVDTPPWLASATVNAEGSEITLTFDENLASLDREATDPATASREANIKNALKVTVDGGRVRGIHRVGFVNEKVNIELEIASYIRSGQSVVVAYSDPTAMDDRLVLEDLAGNDAASFTTGSGGVAAVVNGSTYVDTAAPTFNTAWVVESGDSLTIDTDDFLVVPDDEMMRKTFYETLAGSFAITANGAPVSFTIDPDSSVQNGHLTFDLARPIGMGHRVSVTYTKPDPADPDPVFLDDESGNRAESFSLSTTDPFVVTFFNDSEVDTPPWLASATVNEDGTELTLVFDQAFEAPSSYATLATRFGVSVGGSTASFTLPDASQAPADRQLVLSMATSIQRGQVVVVTYDDPSTGDDSNVIEDAAGNEAADFTTGQDGVPAVINGNSVSFGAASYSVEEGDTVEVVVELSSALDGAVVIPISVANHCGATSADYSGAPTSVTFNAGETRKTFTFSATPDAVAETPESVTLAFGTLPEEVAEGAQATTWVFIAGETTTTTFVADEQDACLDFPGHRWEAHTTPGLVTAGGTGRGHLTPGLDIDHGNSGDYWHLETKRGHSYRLEVRFGDSPTLETGGSAAVSFYQRGSPRNVSGYENDHNREDGRIIINFTHPANWSSVRMLAVVNAWDLFNETAEIGPYTVDSELYHGPYELELTDVTGTERMVTNLRFIRLDRFPGGINTNSRLAASFTTGSHAAGYRLDRIRTYIRPNFGQALAADLADFAIVGNTTAGLPDATELCTLKAPLQVTDWPYNIVEPVEVRPSTVASECADGGVLAANTTYWVTFPKASTTGASFLMNGRQGDTRTNEVAFDSGWSIGDQTAVGDATSFTALVGDPNPFVLPLDIWATKITTSMQTANTEATGAPGIEGSPRLGETLTAVTSGIGDEDGLTDPQFTYQWVRMDPTTAERAPIVGAWGARYTVTVEDEGKALLVTVGFTDDASNEESLESHAVIVSPPLISQEQGSENSPATGEPYVTGTASVGETVVVDIFDIFDEDGLTNAEFSYQWVRRDLAAETDHDIAGADEEEYLVTVDDAGRALKVRVTFTDDAGNAETLTSAATAEVPRLPLTAEFRSAPSTHDGSAAFTFEVRFSESFPLQWRTMLDHALTVTGGSITGARRLDNPHHEPDGIQPNREWRITVEPDSNGDVTIILPITTDCDDTGAVCTEDGRMLSERVEITVAGSGQTQTPLTAEFRSAPSGHDGSAAFTFEVRFSESFPLQWRTMLDHALTVTNGTVTGARRLDNQHHEADGIQPNQEWQITVEPAGNGDVTIILPITTDCTGTGAVCTEDGRMLSERVEITVAGPGQTQTPLTAEFRNGPSGHDGSAAFTFEVRFSESFPLPWRTMLDHALTVTGGTVTGARRLDNQHHEPDGIQPNREWRITVEPDSNGDVTIILPITTDCDDTGAVCTEDGRMLSERVEITIPGPGG